MATEGFFERVYEVVEQIPEGMVATYGQGRCSPVVRAARATWAMRCTAIRAPARFPAIVWCLPMGTSARALRLAAPMLNVSFCWGRA